MSINDCSGEIPVRRGRPERVSCVILFLFATFVWKVCSERTNF